MKVLEIVDHKVNELMGHVRNAHQLVFALQTPTSVRQTLLRFIEAGQLPTDPVQVKAHFHALTFMSELVVEYIKECVERNFTSKRSRQYLLSKILEGGALPQEFSTRSLLENLAYV
jgi:hypothetical protein